MKCIMCDVKYLKNKKKFIDKETRTCYKCLTELDNRNEEYLFISSYEIDGC
mgnify:CR=1 FL=1